jgi:DNA-binding NarL/FixJ family response regulator
MDTSHGAAVQISVFIVSNVRLHREGLVALLRGCPSIKVLGADSVQETQNVLRTTSTDVALIDGPSPGDSDLIMALRKICARIRILAVGIRKLVRFPSLRVLVAGEIHSPHDMTKERMRGVAA